MELMVDKPKTKPFTWSYSKLKNFETCPMRYNKVDILKLYDVDTVELDRGNRLHKAMADRIMKGVTLPIEFGYMERWAEKLTTLFDAKQTIQCELKLAMSRQHKGVAYYDKKVWLRGVIDYLNMVPDHDGFFIHIVDYKTGKPKDDDTQLILNAALVYANYPFVSKIRTTFLWTEYNDTRHMIVTRGDISIDEIVARVSKLEMAHIANNFPPIKNGLCKNYCPVIECEFHGRR